MTKQRKTLIRNRQVVGSIPTAGSIFSLKISNIQAKKSHPKRFLM